MSCPETHPYIISQLCELHCLPGECEKRCKAHLRRWLETEPEVQRLHRDYMEEKRTRREADEARREELKKYKNSFRVINGGKNG